mmetsp:Transcript_51502/g.137444  ORF Transcript_51502/g.137444 Transcript_51502/m.137444 type:complete len:89 (+) Transcript_51502:88-354(+)
MKSPTLFGKVTGAVQSVFQFVIGVVTLVGTLLMFMVSDGGGEEKSGKGEAKTGASDKAEWTMTMDNSRNLKGMVNRRSRVQNSRFSGT